MHSSIPSARLANCLGSLKDTSDVTVEPNYLLWPDADFLIKANGTRVKFRSGVSDHVVWINSPSGSMFFNYELTIFIKQFCDRVDQLVWDIGRCDEMHGADV